MFNAPFVPSPSPAPDRLSAPLAWRHSLGGRPPRRLASLVLLTVGLGVALPASAADSEWSIGTYAAGWEGAYGAAGLGGRLGWEFFPDELGVEVFGEAALVETPARQRRDHQLGFNLYTPIRLSERWRLKPLIGFCVVLSFVELDDPSAGGADDILFGLHGGLGAEFALFDWLSLFLDVQAVGYTGHDRTAGGWTASISDDLTFSGLIQGNLGVQLHFGH